MLTVVRHNPGFTEKPTEIVRGASARLPWAWDGLCFGLPLNEPSNEGLRDVVSGVMPTTIAGQTWVDDDRGNPALKFTNVDPCYLEWPDNPRHDRPTTELTAYVRVKNQGTAVSYGAAFCNAIDTGGLGGASPYMTWCIRAAGATPDVRIESLIAIGSTNYYSGDSGAVPSGFYHAFMRWRTGENIYFTALNERGTLVTEVTGSTVPGSLAYGAGYGIRLNASDNDNNNYDGVYSQAMVWSRRLSDTEIQALALDPFGWYTARRTTVTVAAPFPVGPGLAAPGMTHAGFGFR